jgi:hypothetical protein
MRCNGSLHQGWFQGFVAGIWRPLLAGEGQPMLPGVHQDVGSRLRLAGQHHTSQGVLQLPLYSSAEWPGPVLRIEAFLGKPGSASGVSSKVMSRSLRRV